MSEYVKNAFVTADVDFATALGKCLQGDTGETVDSDVIAADSAAQGSKTGVNA